MRDLKKLILSISIGLGLSGCAGAPPKPPEITVCSIYRPGIANCEPSDPRKPDYDIDLNHVDALGYKLTPPEEYAKFYVWLEELIEWIRYNLNSRRR